MTTCLPFVGSVGIPLHAIRENPLHHPVFLSISSPYPGVPTEVINKVMELAFCLSADYIGYLRYLRQLKECSGRENVILLECLFQPPSADLFQQSPRNCIHKSLIMSSVLRNSLLPLSPSRQSYRSTPHLSV